MPAPTIDRKCHWLRKNTRSRRPEYLVFVDGESFIDPLSEQTDLHTFRLGWACLTRYTPETGLQIVGWHKIEDPVSFWNTLSPIAYEQGQLYVISHNIDYDARVLHAFTILPGIGWSPDYLILSDSCHFFTFKAGKAKISLLDNLNYWHLPLEELGEEFGLPKLHVDFDTCSDEELSTYCHRDVEILTTAWRYWLDFLDTEDLGEWAITTSGQSWNAYRHRFMPAKIGIHNRADAIRLERESYKGGRCEVWRLGHFQDGPYYKLDINGSYSYVMREFPSPQKLVKVIVDVSPAYLRTLLERYLVVAEVLVETWEPVYPLQLDGYNIFPVGQFRTCLTTPELQYALDNGHLRGIGEVALYEPKKLFVAFIDHFTALRQRHADAGDHGRSLLCKLIRNSLYGKFGQRGYEQEIIGDAPLGKVALTKWIDGETGEKCVDWTFGGKTIRQTYKGEAEDSFPAIASHVAAHGRMILWGYALQAGLDNVLYADTDSLIVNQAGYDALAAWIDPQQLGRLKVEAVCEDLEIFARKSYAMGKDRVIKGIKKKATFGDDGKWHQTQFTSLKWAFGAGNLDDVITYDVAKEEHLALYHGTVDKQGHVHPPELGLFADDVAAVISPENDHSWTWWIDPVWFRSLPQRERKEFLPGWFWSLLQHEPISPLNF